MQASQVKLDGVYGINVRGTLVGLRVTEIITVKTGSGSSNYVSGPFEWTDGTRHMAEKKPVKDLIDDFETLKKLEKERAEREAARTAAAAAKLAKQQKAVELLAAAIGAKAIKGGRYDKGNGYDQNAPMVMADGSNTIDINDLAWDGLIDFLEGSDEITPELAQELARAAAVERTGDD